MKKRLKLTHKGLILVCVPIVCQLIFVFFLIRLLQHADQAILLEIHSKFVQSLLSTVMTEVKTTAAGLELNLVVDEPMFLHDYNAGRNSAPHHFRLLEAIVQDNPVQIAAVRKQEQISLELFKFLASVKVLAEEKGRTQAISYVQENKHKLKEWFSQLTQASDTILEEDARHSTRDPDAFAHARGELQKFIIVGMVLSIVAALQVAVLFMRGIATRLNVLTDNAVRMVAHRELNPPLRGHDEIAMLDQVFHDMAHSVAEAARKERAILDNAVDVICSIDADGRFSGVNPAVSKIWGYQPADLIGRRVVSLVPSDQSESFHGYLERAQSSEESVSFENQVLGEDGTCIDMLWSVYWSPRERSLFCVVHDISERKALERFKQDVIAMVSHDIRSPLSSIHAFLNLLTMGVIGDIPEQLQNTARTVERSSSRLINLVNDLLDIEKMESGKLQIEAVPTVANSLSRAAIDAVHGLLAENGINILDECPPLEVVVDAERIVQVVVNLLSNAIKFSPRGGTIRILACRKDSLVEMQVIDEGRGIPAEFQAVLFQRYGQVSLADGKRATGTGLGLAISKAIVELHGGTIGVNSEEGHGSTFWFTMPASEALESSQQG